MIGARGSLPMAPLDLHPQLIRSPSVRRLRGQFLSVRIHESDILPNPVEDRLMGNVHAEVEASLACRESSPR